MKGFGCLHGLQLTRDIIGGLLCVSCRRCSVMGQPTVCAAALGTSMAAAEVSQEQEIVGTQVSNPVSGQWEDEHANVLWATQPH